MKMVKLYACRCLILSLLLAASFMFVGGLSAQQAEPQGGSKPLFDQKKLDALEKGRYTGMQTLDDGEIVRGRLVYPTPTPTELPLEDRLDLYTGDN